MGLVHGLGASGATWKPLIDRMRSDGRYTVIAVDLRGHGNSDRAASYKLDDFADDVAENLPDGLHSIIGHSLADRSSSRRRAPRPGARDLPRPRLSARTARHRRHRTPVLARPAGVPRPGANDSGATQRQSRSADRTEHSDSARAAPMGNSTRAWRSGLSRRRLPSARPLGTGRPSTIVLSDDSPAVISNDLAGALEKLGWNVCRLPGLHHYMHLENADVPSKPSTTCSDDSHDLHQAPTTPRRSDDGSRHCHLRVGSGTR